MRCQLRPRQQILPRRDAERKSTQPVQHGFSDAHGTGVQRRFRSAGKGKIVVQHTFEVLGQAGYLRGPSFVVRELHQVAGGIRPAIPVLSDQTVDRRKKIRVPIIVGIQKRNQLGSRLGDPTIPCPGDTTVVLVE
jgi:hypothetical protein